MTDSGIPWVTNVGTISPGSGDLPIEVVRSFVCEPPPAAELEVLELDGERLLLQPTSLTPCSYLLVHRDDAGVDELLTPTPSGYLMAGLARASGAAVACASNVIHTPEPGGPLNGRVAQSVSITCFLEVNGVWSPGVEVVAPAPASAAWVVEVSAIPNMSGAFAVTWVRDSTFQFFNVSDLGRPPTDGVWSTPLAVTGTTLTPGTPTHVSPSVRLDATQAEWEPGAPEHARYGELMDLDAGPCVTGCLLDGGP